MSVVFIGDLHLDSFTDFGIRRYWQTVTDKVPLSTDLVVLVGDICDGNPLQHQLVVDFLTALSSRYKRVVAVLGNHDYYHRSCEWSLVGAYRLLGIDVFNNQCVEFDGVGTVLFSTLWAGLTDESNIHNTVAVVNDFAAIKDFTPEYCITEHNRAVKYIKENYHKADYVVTHFAPSYMSKSEQYKNKPQPHIDQYFYTELFNYGALDSILDSENSVQWVHGHTHTTLQYSVTDNLTVSSVGACEFLHLN